MKIPIEPMLAYDLEKYQNKLQYPIYVQPKLDGYRCLAYCDTSTMEVRFYSRKGKEFAHLGHIREYLESWMITQKFRESFYLDGELFIPESGEPEAELIYKLRSYLGKKELSRENEIQQRVIHYHLFDAYFPNDPSRSFEKRWDWIQNNFAIRQRANKNHTKKSNNNQSPIELVPTILVHSQAELLELRDHYLSRGSEGIIVRKLEGIYRVGYKSQNVLRSKKIFSNKFIISNFLEAKGKNKGSVIWVFKCKKSNRTFQARPMGTMEERKKWFKEGVKWIGKEVVVKYFDVDKDGCVRRNPVAVVK
jgi:ATP-dependent DNA ligase